MANVNFSKPSRFEVFKLFYVRNAQERHHDNPYWGTYSEVLWNLGGSDVIYDVFSLFGQITEEAQKRICGFTDADITQFLENEDAGRIYAEAICR